jgi:ribonucleotide reductase class II
MTLPVSPRVRKRNGSVVEFDELQLRRAILLAFNDSAECVYDGIIDNVVNSVRANLMNHAEEVDVETIQDYVVSSLFSLGCRKTGEAYVAFRKKKDLLRAEPNFVPPSLELVEETSVAFKTDLQMFNYIDKYARFQSDLGRRETWPETVGRIMGFITEFVESRYPGVVQGSEWERITQSLRQLKATPSMRMVQMAGPAANRCNVAIYNCAFAGLSDIEYLSEMLYILMQGTGVGFSVESEFVEDLPKIKKWKSTAKPEVITVEDSTEGWCNAFRDSMHRWWDGFDVTIDDKNIRPAGAILKTKGGKASGPAPLHELLDFTRDVIRGRQGRRLRDIDVHDIACKTGKIVHLGGVRRAALISLTDLDSGLMRGAKDGAFYLSTPDRTMANNSAVYLEKPDQITFMTEWLNLARSGSGERGIFNRGSLPLQMPARRRKSSRGHVIGANPCGEINLRSSGQFCVSGDTPLITLQGFSRIQDVVGQTVDVWNGSHWSKVVPVQTGSDQRLFRVHFSDGSHLDTTAYHRFSVSTPQGRHGGLGWQEKPLTELMESKQRWATEPFSIVYEGGRDVKDAYTIGFAVGDGYVHRKTRKVQKVAADLYGGKDSQCPVAGTRHKEYLPKNYNVAKTRVNISAVVDIKPETLTGFKTDATALEDVFSWSRSSILQFIAGWLDADGSQSGNGGVRLYLADQDRGEMVQLLLSKCGIRSSVCLHQRAGTPTNLGIRKRDSYYVQITDCGSVPCVRLDTSRGHKSEMKSKFQTIRKIEPLPGCYNTYCFEEADRHMAVFCNTLTYQCNLSIGIIRPEDTFETIKDKVEVATIFGILQSLMTEFRYIRSIWKENCEEERLLGVDLLGAQDCPLLRPSNPDQASILGQLRDHVVQVASAWSQRFGINMPAALTCLKPGGNSGVTFQTGNSVTGWMSRYAIRHVRVNAINPMAKFLIDSQVPHYPEYSDPNPEDPNIWVFAFPMKAPEGAVLSSDLVVDASGKAVMEPKTTAIEQLENWATFKVHWTEHNPSVTVYVGPDEWIDTASWIYKHWDIVGGLSFMPRSNKVYPLAPITPVTEAEYMKLVEGFPKISWEKFFRYEAGLGDTTTLSGEFACTGDKCAI